MRRGANILIVFRYYWLLEGWFDLAVCIFIEEQLTRSIRLSYEWLLFVVTGRNRSMLARKRADRRLEISTVTNGYYYQEELVQDQISLNLLHYSSSRQPANHSFSSEARASKCLRNQETGRPQSCSVYLKTSGTIPRESIYISRYIVHQSLSDLRRCPCFIMMILFLSPIANITPCGL